MEAKQAESIQAGGDEIVADGPTRDILSDPVLMERHGLEVPFLLSRIKDEYIMREIVRGTRIR